MSLKQTGRHKINLSTHLHVFTTFSHLSVKSSCVYFSLSIPTDRAHDTSYLEFPFNCGYSTSTLNNSWNNRLGWGEGSVAPLSFCNVLLHTGVHGLTGLMLSSNMLHVQILIERFNCTCTIQVCPMAKSLGRGSTALRSSTKTLSTVLQRCPPVHVSIIKELYATISHVPHPDCSQKRVPLSTSNPYSERFTNTQCLHVKQHLQ